VLFITTAHVEKSWKKINAVHLQTKFLRLFVTISVTCNFYLKKSVETGIAEYVICVRVHIDQF